MADRKLDVKLISAKDLKKVNKSKMHVYVVAWVDPIVRVQGPVDKTNGCNPVWEESTITVMLEARALAQNMKLNIELVGQGFLSTKPVGYVAIDLTELLQQGATGAASTAQFLDHEVVQIFTRSSLCWCFISCWLPCHQESYREPSALSFICRNVRPCLLHKLLKKLLEIHLPRNLPRRFCKNKFGFTHRTSSMRCRWSTIQRLLST